MMNRWSVIVCPLLIACGGATGSAAPGAPPEPVIAPLKVTVTHPAAVPLPGNRIVLGSMTGTHVVEIRQRLRAELIQHGIGVVDFGALRPAADSAGTVLLTLREGPISKEQSLTSGNGDCPPKVRSNCPRFNRANSVTLGVNVVVGDLAGGHKPVETWVAETRMGPAAPNESGYTPPRSASSVVAEAAMAVASDIRQLFEPTTRVETLDFFAADRCRMSATRALLASGDTDGARRSATEGVRLCRAEADMSKRIVAEAQFDAGIVAYVAGDWATAAQRFREAQATAPIAAAGKMIRTIERARGK